MASSSGVVSAIVQAPVNPVISVAEFYHPLSDHYFVSADPAEIRDLETGVHAGWVRTGASFRVLNSALAGSHPVCRFYIPPQLGDSHFFSAAEEECAAVLQNMTGNPNFAGYVYETPAAFYVVRPDVASGACPSGTQPVYRLWNARADSNHRYTTDPSERARMIATGYVSEGYGPTGVSMCAVE